MPCLAPPNALSSSFRRCYRRPLGSRDVGMPRRTLRRPARCEPSTLRGAPSQPAQPLIFARPRLALRTLSRRPCARLWLSAAWCRYAPLLVVNQCARWRRRACRCSLAPLAGPNPSPFYLHPLHTHESTRQSPVFRRACKGSKHVRLTAACPAPPSSPTPPTTTTPHTHTPWPHPQHHAPPSLQAASWRASSPSLPKTLRSLASWWRPSTWCRTPSPRTTRHVGWPCTATVRVWGCGAGLHGCAIRMGRFQGPAKRAGGGGPASGRPALSPQGGQPPQRRSAWHPRSLLCRVGL